MNATTPEPSVLLILFRLFLLTMLGGSCLAWISVITWFRMGGKSIPVEPRRPAPWGLIHFVGIFVLFVTVGTLTIKALDSLFFASMIATFPPEQQEGLKTMSRMFSGSLSQIITMVLASVMIAVTTRATAEDLGWSLKKIAYDIVVGLGAAILFLPIIQIIMASLVFLLDQEYDHPLLEALNAGPALWMFAGAFFAAVIAAPITEEFLFRVILQGMLEANASRPFTWQRLILGNMLDEPTPPTTAEATSEHQANVVSTAVPIWPLFLSGTLFGLAHAEYGPSWFPLILMGILLGYLYRCTHRIWPCWIVHITLNAISMIGFGLQVMNGNPISSLW